MSRQSTAPAAAPVLPHNTRRETRLLPPLWWSTLHGCDAAMRPHSPATHRQPLHRQAGPLQRVRHDHVCGSQCSACEHTGRQHGKAGSLAPVSHWASACSPVACFVCGDPPRRPPVGALQQWAARTVQEGRVFLPDFVLLVDEALLHFVWIVVVHGCWCCCSACLLPGCPRACAAAAACDLAAGAFVVVFVGAGRCWAGSRLLLTGWCVGWHSAWPGSLSHAASHTPRQVTPRLNPRHRRSMMSVQVCLRTIRAASPRHITHTHHAPPNTQPPTERRGAPHTRAHSAHITPAAMR